MHAVLPNLGVSIHDMDTVYYVLAVISNGA